MTLHRRILTFYTGTLLAALLVICFWSWFEFHEQRQIVFQEGVEAAMKESPLVETLEILLVGGIPALLIALVGGHLLMKRALAPITELTEALEKTDVSNLSNSVPRSGNGDELDRMTAVFNRMKERLGLSFTQARDFTLNASHELKTPLTIMHITLEQMTSNVKAAEVDRERAASLLEEVQRLSSIVGQLSFLARADAGLLPSAREPVALDILVRDLAEETMILASGAEISVTLGECQSVSVSGDKMRLRQLLLNLADNAVKYNERGGSIEMTLVRQNDDAVFTITNTGIALPVELRSRVFERFFRGDLAHNSATEGSGLGLSIAKSIVEAHQGVIGYSVLPDGRTQVVVTLPSPR
jgi:two-component system heavy metal sensor histidine kinase CusS